MLGWTILGPSGERATNRVNVNGLKAYPFTKSEILPRAPDFRYDSKDLGTEKYLEDKKEFTSTKPTILHRDGHSQLRWSGSHDSRPDDEHAICSGDYGPPNHHTQKALDHSSCVEVSCVRVRPELPYHAAIKRGIHSRATFGYDSLGYVAPLSLHSKRLFREFFSHNSAWDDIVEPSTWETWKRDDQVVESPRLPYRNLPSWFNKVHASLHLFSDGSKVGHGSVVYMRGENICNELQPEVLSLKLMRHVLKKIRRKFRLESSIVPLGRSVCGKELERNSTGHRTRSRQCLRTWWVCAWQTQSL